MQRKPNQKDIDSFINGAKDQKVDTGQQINIEPKEAPSRKRQTYYIDDIHIEALDQMAFYEKLDKSEIVRRALEEYIPKKYFSLAVKKM